jgi:hypothetical protein
VPVIEVHFASTLARATPEKSYTLTALRAIHRTLSDGYIFSTDIKENRRSLRIISRDRKAVNVLNSMRSGTGEDLDLNPIQQKVAQSIIDVMRHVKAVEFEVLKDHASDSLSLCADRLACAARRHEDMADGNGKMKAKIVNDQWTM